MDLSQIQDPFVRRVFAELNPPPHLWTQLRRRITQMREWGAEVDIEAARRCLEQLMDERHVSPGESHIEATSKPHPGRYDVRPRSPIVYYVLLGNRVKIGTTTNLERRLQNIQPEQVLALEDGDEKLERSRHATFRNLRVSGEWFRHESPLVEFIADLPRYTGRLARYLT